jgi:CMP-N-acetylneuraminic acid synthetase
MAALAIILARAGSKGVPGKNTAPIAGRPCIAWTIDAAQNANCVSKVVVSTDSEETTRISQSLGTDIHTRSADLASDTATVDDAAREALAAIDPDAHFNTIVLLYANVPVRPPDLIDRAVNLLQAEHCDSVQSYTAVGKHHPWWTARIDDAGNVTPWQGDILNHNIYRRQDLPPAHIPDGGVLALTRPALTRQLNTPPGPHAFLGNDCRGITTKEGDVIDIDTPIDLVIADTILRQR